MQKRSSGHGPAAVDDVEGGHGEHKLGVASQLAKVLVEGHALSGGAGLGHGQGDPQDGVGAQLGLVLGAVQLDHGLVNGGLVRLVAANELGRNDRVHVAHGREHALAHVAFSAVAEFAGLVGTRGGARGHRGGEHALLRGHVHLYGGVPAGVDDLTGVNLLDRLSWLVGKGKGDCGSCEGCPRHGLRSFVRTMDTVWRARVLTFARCTGAGARKAVLGCEGGRKGRDESGEDVGTCLSLQCGGRHIFWRCVHPTRHTTRFLRSFFASSLSSRAKQPTHHPTDQTDVPDEKESDPSRRHRAEAVLIIPAQYDLCEKEEKCVGIEGRSRASGIDNSGYFWVEGLGVWVGCWGP